MSLRYLVKHEIAICGTWQHYFYNFGDVKKVFFNLNRNFVGPEVWPPNSPDVNPQNMGADAGPQYMMSTNWSSINKAINEWCSRLTACVCAKGRHFEFFCFVEHEHYFFACLTVCLRNFINVAEIAKTTLVFHKLQFCVLQGSVETLFRWSKKYLYRFVTNLFRITCAKFYKNWLSFVEDITKTILVCFLWDTV